MTTDRDRLERVLGGASLAGLRARLRRRFARGMRATTHLTLTKLSAHEREALAGLIGRRVRDASSIRISLVELDQTLADAGLADSLSHALELLDGPIIDGAAERERRERAWQEAFAACADPRLSTLLELAANRGLIKRLAPDPAAGRTLLCATEAVLAHLPAPGVTRSQLAADALGDAHALDSARPIATLVLAALGPVPGERPRETWARAGVMVNELAKPALVLNLPAADGGGSAAGELANLAAISGEPLHLSLRALLRQDVRWDVSGRHVFVCENPNLLAIAADRLGPRSAPLVCTDGMPSASQRTLLRQLAEHGARLRYHGDFDWAGVRIANHVLRVFGASAWRFDAAHYRVRAGRPLRGAPVEASWDAALAPAMLAGGSVLEEEAEEVATVLMDDLSGSSG